MIRAEGQPSPFVVLLKTFLAQFFTSDSVTSDEDLRKMLTGVVAFLLPPVLFLMVNVFPSYQIVVLVATKRHLPGMIDDMLAWIAFILVTYSMVTVGFIAVCVWDALSFNRRDAMTLGPLPLRGTTIIVAKLMALGVFLLGTSTAVNLLNGLAFATTTANQFSAGLPRHFLGPMIALIVAATFVFATIVAIRGVLTLVGSARLTALLGSMLQFLFVVALLCFVIMIVQARSTRPVFLETGAATWNPSIWFVGLFEHLRGSPRFEWIELARRALLATIIAATAAAMLSIAGFRRQMQLALTPPAMTGPLGSARLSRMLASWIVGRDGIARATADFMLLTIARNRPQQGPIAINAAIGVAMALAGLSRSSPDLASLMHPRTAVLWIPLLIGYWTAIGLRASFFVPSELPASWSFRANAPEPTEAYWSAARASMIALLVPMMIMVNLVLIGPLLGSRVTLWHTLVGCSLVILLTELLALTIDFVPFTRAYEPGHAKLKTRWPLYALGVLSFAYVPARLELNILDNPASLIWMLAGIGAAIVVLEVIGRHRSSRWSIQKEDPDYRWDETMLDIGRVARVNQ
jgi:hypothetical protein